MGSRDAKHWEQVHNWVCAPADDSGDLYKLDLVLDTLVFLLVCCLIQTMKEFIHNEAEEEHRQSPASPSRAKVSGDDKLTVVSRHNHQSRTEAKTTGEEAKFTLAQLH